MAYSMQKSTDSTNKFSFKGAGIVYRKSYTLQDKINLLEKKVVVKKLNNSSSANATLSNSREKQYSSPTFSNKTVPNKTSEYISIGTENNHDFRVLSSFECNGSVPSAFKNYISNTFISEYKRSYVDFNMGNMLNTEALPNLTDVQINCVLDQPCQTLFQYDKQRGLNETYPKENIFVGSDKIHPRKNVLYCCPPIDYLTDQTLGKECNEAKSVIKKSTFRESKKPFLLERVNSSLDIFPSFILIHF